MDQPQPVWSWCPQAGAGRASEASSLYSSTTDEPLERCYGSRLLGKDDALATGGGAVDFDVYDWCPPLPSSG